MRYDGRQSVYEVERLIARGGMAEVYLAHLAAAPEQRVAIKVPLPGIDAAIRQLFLREAEAASKVSNPHIVRVLDWGDNPAFIAFEFVEGGTLEAELQRRQGPQEFWTEPELIGLYLQLADAMDAINAAVIHRDLKSSNIFFSHGELKVSDFGISKYVGEGTRSRTFKDWGTLSHMSPEAWQSESVDWRADQYSMGVVLYEMATLARPFSGPEAELRRKHLYEAAPRVTTVRAGLSERLATLVGRMLAKNRDERFPSWEAIREELTRLQQRHSDPAAPASSDPLAAVAARHLEDIRQRELERKRAEDEARASERERSDLLGYWTDTFFGQVEGRVARINDSLGSTAVQFSRHAGGRAQGPGCQARFIQGQLDLSFFPMPLDAPPGLLAWGWGRLVTFNRVWGTNFLLLAEPEPYGTWQEIDLEVSALITDPNAVNEEDRGRGKYERVSNTRVVIAMNVEGLLFQRELRNTMSILAYAERPLNFEARMDEILQVLLEDGGLTAPPRR